MDLMRYQPTLDAGRGKNRADGCYNINFESEPEISEQEIKEVKPQISENDDLPRFLYDACWKSDISERDLQEVYAKLYKDVDLKEVWSVSVAQSVRQFLSFCRMQGELLLLCGDDEKRDEILFESEEEHEMNVKKTMAILEEKKQAKARRKLMLSENPELGSDEQRCDVCMMVTDDHIGYNCPYLDDIPNPEKATVGKGYEIYCHHCLEPKSEHGHPDGTWAGFAGQSNHYESESDEEEGSEAESDEEEVLEPQNQMKKSLV